MTEPTTTKVAYPLAATVVTRHKSVVGFITCRHDHQTEEAAMACGRKRVKAAR